MNYVKTESLIKNSNRQYLPERDGIHREFGCAKNVFPRTLFEAYGIHTTLYDVHSKKRISKEIVLFYVVMFLLAMYVIMHIDPSAAFVR